jgi:hypothetical protein
MATQKIKCRASKKDGSPCTNWAIIGALVCRMHGGGAPHVREAGQRRASQAEYNVMQSLEKHLETAVNTLVAVMNDQTAKPMERQRAAEAIIDRFAPKKAEVKVDDQREVRDLDAEIDSLIEERQADAS